MRDFNIAQCWSGAVIHLEPTKNYHATIPITDEPRRHIKAGTQKAVILHAMSVLGQATPRDLQKYLGHAYIITSIRARLNALMRHGLIRKGEEVPGPMDHVETQWVYVQ